MMIKELLKDSFINGKYLFAYVFALSIRDVGPNGST